MSPNPREATVEAASTAAAAAVVVVLALTGVAQHVVGVSHVLETLGGVGTGIHVGVQLTRQPTVGLLDLVGGGVTGDAEHFVMVSHSSPLSFSLIQAFR